MFVAKNVLSKCLFIVLVCSYFFKCSETHKIASKNHQEDLLLRQDIGSSQSVKSDIFKSFYNAVKNKTLRNHEKRNNNIQHYRTRLSFGKTDSGERTDPAYIGFASRLKRSSPPRTNDRWRDESNKNVVLKTRSYSPNKNIQNDDLQKFYNNHFLMKDSLNNLPSSYRGRNPARGKFRHYNDFYEPHDSLQSLSYGNNDQGMIPNILSNSPSYTKRNVPKQLDSYGKTYDYNTANSETSPNVSVAISEFPKTILKDGQVFYRQDLIKDEESKISSDRPPKSSIKKSSFDLFTDEAQKLNNKNSGSLRKSFNLLLDHVRQVGSQVPITSAAIAAAGVTGNTDGMTSHAIGTALNQGYFAAIAKGRDNSGDFTESIVQGDGLGAKGTSTAVVAPGTSGDAYVQVDHSHAGIVEGKSKIKGGEASVYADINYKPRGEEIPKYGQSFGEANSQTYSHNRPNTNAPLRTEDLAMKMFDNMIEEIHYPDAAASGFPYPIPAHDRLFRDAYANNNHIGTRQIIDKNGLNIGTGDPPAESQIQQVRTNIIPEGGVLYNQPKIVEYGNDLNKANLNLNIHRASNYIPNAHGGHNEAKPTENSHFYKYEYTYELPLKSSTLNYAPNSNNKQNLSTISNINSQRNKNINPTSIPLSKRTYGSSNFNDYNVDPSMTSRPKKNAQIRKKEIPYESEGDIPDEELYPNPHTSSSSYNYDYTAGDSVEYDYDASIHNILYAIPEPEPFPVSPLAPAQNQIKNIENPINNTSQLQIPYDNDGNSSTINSISKFSLDASTQKPTTHPVQIGSNKGSSLIPNSYKIPYNYPLIPGRISLPDNPSGSEGSKKVSPNNDLETSLRYDRNYIGTSPSTIPSVIVDEIPTPISKTDSSAGTQMMQMRFLNPGAIGASRIIEPIQPQDPVIKLITVESNSLPHQKGTLIQPGRSIPGLPAYKIPLGFRGRLFLGNYKILEPNSNNNFNSRNFHQPRELVGPTHTRRSIINAPRTKSWNEQNRQKENVMNGNKRNSSANRDCGYYSSKCRHINYMYSCTPVYIQVSCCC